MSTTGFPSPSPARGAAPDPRDWVRLAALFYGGMFVAAWLWRSAWFGESLWVLDAASAARARPALDLALGLACGGAIVVLSHFATERTGWGEALARALAHSLGALSLRQVWLLALFSGIAEEAFFRGALQPRIGYVASSVIFGLVHFVPRRAFLPWTAFSLAAGFLLGGLFLWTGNLLAPIAAHVFVNGVNLRILVTRYSARA